MNLTCQLVSTLDNFLTKWFDTFVVRVDWKNWEVLLRCYSRNVLKGCAVFTASKSRQHCCWTNTALQFRGSVRMSVMLLHILLREHWTLEVAINLFSHTDQSLGAFEKLRKATISCVMSVRLSVHTEHLASHWTDLYKIWYLIIFRKSVEKNQVSFKSDKNKGYFTWRPIYIFDHIWFISS